MASIAKWFFATGLAAAKINLLARICTVFDRCKRAAFVRTVAKGLCLALTARAPPVIFALFHVDCEGCVCGANRVGHDEEAPVNRYFCNTLLSPFCGELSCARESRSGCLVKQCAGHLVTRLEHSPVGQKRVFGLQLCNNIGYQRWPVDAGGCQRC